MKKFYGLIFSALLMLSTQSSLHAQNNFPNWAKGIVWYQIFPERFADGDTKNDSSLVDKVDAEYGKKIPSWHTSKWTSDWFAQSSWEKNLGGNFNRHLTQRRYGGDIQGIIDHLDYLKSLGVGAIYLNPMFDAVSLHKYDASTYHHIDVNFGPDPEGDKKIIASENPDDPSTWKWTSADKLFLKLIREVHQRGMKIIIDGVFNHTGTHFWAFQDILKNREKSKYKNWYEITSFSDSVGNLDYHGWWGTKTLPVFNRTKNDLAAGPKKYIFEITKRWMEPNGLTEDGVDGWRLDVANEIPMGFWYDWRKLVKSINPKAIIIGELWNLSPQYVSINGPFDALMNYNFAFAVNKFFVAQKKKISVSDFIKELHLIDETYPEENLDILQNLVDSHDTERISSMIKNPDRKFDYDGGPNNPDYDPSKPTSEDYQIQKLIAVFQMTYRGAPMIYYGDEVGMWGADDPYDRQPMVWSNLKYDDQVITPASGFKKGFGTYKVEQNTDLLNYYQKIIAIRNDNSALKFGDVSFIYSNDKNESFAFEREFRNEKIVAVFNNGDSVTRVEIPVESKHSSYTELLSGQNGVLADADTSGGILITQLTPKSVKIFKF